MMAATPTLHDLRNGIQAIYREVMEESVDGEVSNEAVLDKVKATMADRVEALTPKLVHIALVKILNGVGSRRRVRTVPPDQLDLFEGYRVPDFISVGRNTKKAVVTLTILQAKQYLDAHSRRDAVDRHAQLRRLVADCESFVRSDDDTLAILMERKRQDSDRGGS